MAGSPKQSPSEQAPPPEPGDPAAPVVALAERSVSAVRAGAAAIASRRGLPLVVAGAFVVVLAWVGERDSAWGFPMLIAGALMIGLGMLGPRLSGSLALRWGEEGAFLQLTSAVAPPGKRRGSPQLQDPVAAAAEGEAEDADASLVPPSEIEGEAETIDFKVTAAGEQPKPGPQPEKADSSPSA